MLTANFGITGVTKQTLVARIEHARRAISPRLDPARKTLLGQFFTPGPIAQLMCSMLTCSGSSIRVLDAGAGIGTLSAALVAALCSRPHRPQSLHITAYELDAALIPHLQETLTACQSECERAGIAFSSEVRHEDFIRGALGMLRGDLFVPPLGERYNCAILNPPYRKIQTQSEERLLLRRLGVETTNLYTGFLAAAAQLLTLGGGVRCDYPAQFLQRPVFQGLSPGFP